MLARQNLGRRHEGRLPAGLDHCRGGEERNHGLARADIAVNQPQHACRPRQIGDDVAGRARLRRRQGIRQGCDDAARSRPSPDVPRPARTRRCARKSASASWLARNSS